MMTVVRSITRMPCKGPPLEAVARLASVMGGSQSYGEAAIGGQVLTGHVRGCVREQ